MSRTAGRPGALCLMLAVCGLATAGLSEAMAQQPASDLVLTRVWEGPEPDFWSAKPSPDGLHISEIDWMTGNLAVIDLETGKLRHLTAKGSWTDAVAWAETSVFSPDGEQIAYTWWDEEDTGYGIRIMNTDGSDIRVLYPSPGADFYAMLEDWTDDGEHVLAQLWREEDVTEIVLISVADGTVETVKKWPSDDGGPESCDISADGRFVAYDPAPETEPGKRNIYVVPVDGGDEVAVVQGPGEDVLMGWTQDGSGILFYSDRGLTKGIWMVPVSEGGPTGEPVLLRGGVWRMEPIGFSREAFFYGVSTAMPQVHTARLDLAENRIATPLAPVEDPMTSRTAGAVWSPDGQQLAYRWLPQGETEESLQLTVRSVTGMETRTVETSLRDQGRLLGWAPDGESLFVRGANEEQQGIFRVSLASGEATPLVLREDVQLANTQAFSLSPDGKTLFYSRRGEGSRQEDPLEQEVVPLVSRNLKSGEETELASVGGVNRIAVSPNGGMLALLIMDRADRIWKLAVMPATGGELRELHRVDAPMEFGGAFAWTPDNQHLLFGSWNTTTGFAFVSRIAIDGGAPVRLSGLPESAYMNDMRLSPDGTRAAFNWSGGRGEIWKIENLPGSPSVTAAADQR